MELLLNLVWIALALGGLLVFEQRRRASVHLAQVPHLRALIALCCLVVLLFPIVSASDDLNPTQAVLEDATRRIHKALTLLPQAQSGPFVVAPPSPAFYLLFPLADLWAWRRQAIAVPHSRTRTDTGCRTLSTLLVAHLSA